MTDCVALTDRMPMVAHGQDRWTADEAAHLTGCASCAAEWRLMGPAMRLGDDAAARLQPDVVATRVLAQVRARRPRPFGARLWLRWAPMALAAMLVVAVVGREGMISPSAEAVSAGDILPEFQDLTEAQLETLLEAVPTADGTVEIRGFNDLTDDDVSSLLTNLEG